MTEKHEIYNLSAEAVLKEVKGFHHGLTPAEASARLAQNGKNRLKEEKKTNVLVLFLSQLANVMTIILIVAAVISMFFHEVLDAIVIMAVVLLNTLIGTIQELKAEKAIKALQQMTAAKATVKRDGHIVDILTEDLVVGDVVMLEAGDSVPCDMRLLKEHSLKIEEAALTGESLPSEKTDAQISGTVPLGDRKNMAFMGTNVVYGRAEGIAVATGMNTQIGKIADMLSEDTREKTPFERRMDGVGKTVSIAMIAICIAMFGVKLLYNIGKLDGQVILDGLLLAISLAVAAIPEGLTACITLTMTLGVTRMSKRNAIIRKLPAIETLGSAEIVCSDKTGTITQNRMTVVKTFTLSTASSRRDGTLPSAKTDTDLSKLATCGVLCNDSVITETGVTGDPTETALTVHAQSSGFDPKEIIRTNERVAELPFDSVRKVMSTINKGANGIMTLYAKGAPDEILTRCNQYLADGAVRHLDPATRARIVSENSSMAGSALRVLGFAYKPFDRDPRKSEPNFSDENNMVFIGLSGMIDPVRPEVKGAVKQCFEAGIQPIMITGDHLITAVAIGKELGLIKDESEAIAGKDLDKLSDAEFERLITKYKVYARVSPENKVRIVRFWKKRGKIVAMTGDGVNDAPAIKMADIGVGMGITGTDVTKSVADMVLADDNFATIIMAVEEGRKIFSNIKKIIQFLLSTNFCEVLTLFIASLFNFTVLLPAQILWVNLVTDTVPAVGLGMEKADPNSMLAPPSDPKRSVFSDRVGFNIGYQSVIMFALVFGAFFSGIASKVEGAGMTMAFVTLSVIQIAHSFNAKTAESILNKDIFRNRVLTFGGLLCALATVLLLYIPGLNTAFNVVPLPLPQLVLSLTLALAIIPIIELAKLAIAYYDKKAKEKKATNS